MLSGIPPTPYCSATTHLEQYVVGTILIQDASRPSINLNDIEVAYKIDNVMAFRARYDSCDVAVLAKDPSLTWPCKTKNNLYL